MTLIVTHSKFNFRSGDSVIGSGYLEALIEQALAKVYSCGGYQKELHLRGFCYLALNIEVDAK